MKRRRSAATIAVLMMLVAAGMSRADEPLQWLSEGTSPLAGGYGEGIVSTTDDVYILECQDVSSQCNFYRYSVSDSAWNQESTEGLESGSFRNGTALTWDGSNLIYALAGARYSDTYRTHFLRYWITENRWEAIADSPAAQGAGNAITWSGYDSMIYAFIGSAKHNVGSSYFARYSPHLNTWQVLSSPWRSTEDGASLVWDGDTKLYALRGEYDESVPNGEFARFDLVDETWEVLAELPDSGGVGDGGSLLSIAQWDSGHADYIYALSGGSASEEPGYGFYMYRISTDTWVEMAALPCPIGYYVGQRLAYTSGSFYYWQGSPTSDKWICGGDAFYSMQVTMPPTQPDSEASSSMPAVGIDTEHQVATLPDGTLVTLYDDFTWEYYNQGFTYDFDFSTLTPDTLPDFLRQGIQADVATQTTAVEMYLQGWRYKMPAPKSTQAAWGNSDGRTTWWYGYWHSTSTEQVSDTQPVKKENGLYEGDNQDHRYSYRRGGSPRYPNKVEWLLSEYGGVPPLS